LFDQRQLQNLTRAVQAAKAAKLRPESWKTLCKLRKFDKSWQLGPNKKLQLENYSKILILAPESWKNYQKNLILIQKATKN